MRKITKSAITLAAASLTAIAGLGLNPAVEAKADVTAGRAPSTTPG